MSSRHNGGPDGGTDVRVLGDGAGGLVGLVASGDEVLVGELGRGVGRVACLHSPLGYRAGCLVIGTDVVLVGGGCPETVVNVVLYRCVGSGGSVVYDSPPAIVCGRASCGAGLISRIPRPRTYTNTAIRVTDRSNDGLADLGFQLGEGHGAVVFGVHDLDVTSSLTLRMSSPVPVEATMVME